MSDMPQDTVTTEVQSAEIPVNPLGMGSSLGGSISKLTSDGKSTTVNMPPAVKQVIDLLGELPQVATKFFADNKSPVTTLGVIFGGIVGMKLMFAILSAVNEIPLLAPTFELVGIGYSAWFVYRYLLQASTRQELMKDINSFKSEILGQK
jgi:hypothetical protein